MIRTENLTKVFRTDEIETTALNSINLTVDEKDFVAIMGPSGCGKSTLLNVLGMLDKPTSGNYYFLDNNLSNYSESKKAKYRKRNVGMIFQNFNLIEDITVYENVELPLIYMNVSKIERIKLVSAVLEKVQISNRSKHYPNQLSGGQQQRVAVARAVVANPKLILADEPTGNLDSVNGNEVMQLLSNLNNDGTTIIMVTHSEKDARYAKRIVRLYDGSIVNAIN